MYVTIKKYSKKDKKTVKKFKGFDNKHAVEDAMEADKIFSDLMGEEVAPRKTFIEENAALVEDLDI